MASAKRRSSVASACATPAGAAAAAAEVEVVVAAAAARTRSRIGLVRSTASSAAASGDCTLVMTRARPMTMAARSSEGASASAAGGGGAGGRHCSAKEMSDLRSSGCRSWSAHCETRLPAAVDACDRARGTWRARIRNEREPWSGVVECSANHCAYIPIKRAVESITSGWERKKALSSPSAEMRVKSCCSKAWLSLRSAIAAWSPRSLGRFVRSRCLSEKPQMRSANTAASTPCQFRAPTSACRQSERYCVRIMPYAMSKRSATVNSRKRLNVSSSPKVASSQEVKSAGRVACCKPSAMTR
mmetsp:Transcript_19159/g.62457  ORF Transcript_19159/g.62457 Transcript_19159/m.62457 type:complete len:301 (-) Transcript_19159:1162-2064(-)